jgi:hypothetical protein
VPAFRPALNVGHEKLKSVMAMPMTIMTSIAYFAANAALEAPLCP